MEVERSIQNIHLNHGELLALVRKVFVDCNKLDEWGILSGGAFNTTYRFTLGDSKFVLIPNVKNKVTKSLDIFE